MNRRYAGIIKNDVVNGEGVCVSFWTQGCPFHCAGCHNQGTWDPEAGSPLPADYIKQVCDALVENGVQRNLSILGGEPLADWNKELVNELVCSVRARFPHIKIYLWTGFLMTDLLTTEDSVVSSILNKIDYAIDGPFEIQNRDLTLKLRGSINQNIYQKINNQWELIS